MTGFCRKFWPQSGHSCSFLGACSCIVHPMHLPYYFVCPSLSILSLGSAVGVSPFSFCYSFLFGCILIHSEFSIFHEPWLCVQKQKERKRLFRKALVANSIISHSMYSFSLCFLLLLSCLWVWIVFNNESVIEYVHVQSLLQTGWPLITLWTKITNHC